MKITSATLSAFVLMILAAAGAAAFQAAGTNCVGYWSFDETAGPTAFDANGVNNLTYGASPANPTPSTDVPTAMPVGSHSLSFDGVDDGISINAVAGLPTGNTPHSIAAWIKVTALPVNRAWILLLGNEGSGSHHWLIDSGGVTQFGVWGGAPGAAQMTPTLNTGQWTHVVMTFDGTTLAGYVDGAPIGSSAATFNLQGVPLTLATAHLSENAFNGLVDDVRLYTRVLTPAEVTALASGSFGPAAPTGLATTPGAGSVSLTWNALPSGTRYNVRRSTVQGGSPAGTYPLIVSDLTTNSYVDTTAVPGTVYYYVVSGVTYGEGPYSAEVPGTPLAITALPNSNLFTTEAGATTFFDIKLAAAVPGTETVTVTVTSTNPAEGKLQLGTGPQVNQLTISVPGGTAANTSYRVTVFGQPDTYADGNVTYPITVTTSSTNTSSAFHNVPIPDVSVTNNDSDTAQITFSQTSGLQTTESGGKASFTVSLTSQPYGDVVINLSISPTSEGTLSTNQITLNGTNWQAGVSVDVTGKDDSALDFTQPWTVVPVVFSATSDPPYASLPPLPAITGVNLDDEAIPPAKSAWGGSGGGCGLLGLELALPLLLLRRRRRRG